MNWRRGGIGRLARLAVLGLAAAWSIDPALSQTRPPASAEPKTHLVTGFRSAKFGMSEAEVSAAIRKDFGDRQIAHESNMTERTNSLVTRVDNLIPDAGTALIAYVFGATSKKLAQVSLVWGQPVVEKPNVPALVAAANSLRNLFAGQGYAPDSVVANGQLPDGSVLVFRGLDAGGHMTLLQLSLPQSVDPVPRSSDPPGKSSAAAPAKTDSGIAALRLTYVEKPDKPDVFKLEGGF
jgi:hypothetical protein